MKPRGTNRAFTSVDLIAVVGIVAVLLAVALPAASRAGKQELAARCADNERLQLYAALAYAIDWRGQLPAANGAMPTYHSEGFVVPRLPIVGFDTTTAISIPGFYHTSRCSQFCFGLGGWAFMFRDYLKNEKDVIVCPDGWFRQDDIFKGYLGEELCDPRRGGLVLGENVEHFAGLGYFWLPRRRSVAPGSVEDRTVKCSTPRANVDGAADVARTAADAPELIVTADVTSWMAYVHGRPLLAANHHGAERGRGLGLRDPGVPVFDPCEANDADDAVLPLGTNKGHLDCRVTWVAFKDIEPFRYSANGGQWLMW